MLEAKAISYAVYRQYWPKKYFGGRLSTAHAQGKTRGKTSVWALGWGSDQNVDSKATYLNPKRAQNFNLAGGFLRKLYPV